MWSMDLFCGGRGFDGGTVRVRPSCIMCIIWLPFVRREMGFGI
jgi:hypothetical protein